jgi:hypothetical protein
MFYVQTSALPPRMHQNLTKYGMFCKKNNQLPTKSHVELKDNFNIDTILELLVSVNKPPPPSQTAGTAVP